VSFDAGAGYGSCCHAGFSTGKCRYLALSLHLIRDSGLARKARKPE
jgi:hypothetical protein